MDVVRDREGLLGVARVPLERDLDDDGACPLARLLGEDVNDLVVDGLLRLVEELDELADAALVLEDLAPHGRHVVRRADVPVAALVGQRDDEAGVQERQLAEAAREDVELELGRREDLVIGLEGDLRARLVRVADDGERRDGHAPAVLLEVHVPLALDLHLQPLGDGVHRAHADAVQPRGDLVARVIEFPARVQHGHHDLGRADALLVHADGDAAPVVLDGHRPVEVDRHVHA